MLSSMEFQKEDPTEAMATRSLLMCSVIGIFVMTEIGFPLLLVLSSLVVVKLFLLLCHIRNSSGWVQHLA
jgi:hypothetical protein